MQTPPMPLYFPMSQSEQSSVLSWFSAKLPVVDFPAMQSVHGLPSGETNSPDPEYLPGGQTAQLDCDSLKSDVSAIPELSNIPPKVVTLQTFHFVKSWLNSEAKLFFGFLWQ